MIDKIFSKLFFIGSWDIIVFSDGVYSSIKSNWKEWYADPFLIKRDNEYFVLCERKRNFSNIGTIALTSAKSKKIVDIIRENYHLSFPNVFDINNKFYIIPESSRGKSLNLYEFDISNFKVSFKQTLLNDCELVDSIIDISGKKLYSYDKKNKKLIEFTFNSNFELKNETSYIDKYNQLRPAGNPRYGKFFFQNNLKSYGESLYSAKLENNVFEKCYDYTVYQIQEFCSKNHYKKFHTLNFCGDAFVFDAYKEKFNFLKPLFSLMRLFYDYHKTN